MEILDTIDPGASIVASGLFPNRRKRFAFFGHYRRERRIAHRGLRAPEHLDDQVLKHKCIAPIRPIASEQKRAHNRQQQLTAAVALVKSSVTRTVGSGSG